MIQLNLLFWSFLITFLIRTGIQFFLNRLNISYLRRHGNLIPEIFRETIDPEKFRKISAYTVDSANLGLISTLINQIFFLAILLSGFLPWLAEFIQGWGFGSIREGLIFFALLFVLSTSLSIPFSLYATFGIENRYGFNTRTFALWITDLAKSVALSFLLGGLVLWLIFSLIVRGENNWWVWAWILVGGVEILTLWLSPIIIAPLFNKFDPVEDQELKDHIAALMGKAGLRVKGVFRMNASKRSRHSNAYFTGIGKSKRIILFDTLLSSHTKEEILAILAHEIGHWRKKHILKQLLALELFSLVGFYVVGKMLDWHLLYQTFGFKKPLFYAGLLLIGALFSPLSYFAQPVESALSRKFEREADDFSLKLLSTPDSMILALKRLAADNLANLTPHPLYAWFYYSHPPLGERISRLQGSTSNR